MFVGHPVALLCRGFIFITMADTYSDKLKDPRWQKKRLEIMQRDEFMCQCCYDTESMLTVHHKYYIHGKDPWDYPDELLITLCNNCHATEESSKGIITDLPRVLLSDGYLSVQLVQLLEFLRQLPAGDMGLSFLHKAVKEYKSSMPF